MAPTSAVPPGKRRRAAETRYMPKKMLIDASHREETRVAVISGSKVEDFDFESLSKRPLRGNIYLDCRLCVDGLWQRRDYGSTCPR